MARKKNGGGDPDPTGPTPDPLLEPAPAGGANAGPPEPAAPAPIAEPVLAPEPPLDLVLADAPPAAPVAPVVVPASLVPLEDRIRHLEEAINRLQSLEGLEQRLSDRLTGLQREPPPPAGPNVLDAARAVVNVGRTLLPGVAPAAAAPPGATAPGSLLRDALAELQAMYYMYVDPRYRFTWAGRVVPVALLAMFVLSGYWLKFATCGLVDVPLLGWLLNKAVDLLVGYALFKVLSHEAHRYRETAPDLPSHLRR